MPNWTSFKANGGGLLIGISIVVSVSLIGFDPKPGGIKNGDDNVVVLTIYYPKKETKWKTISVDFSLKNDPKNFFGEHNWRIY